MNWVCGDGLGGAVVLLCSIKPTGVRIYSNRGKTTEIDFPNHDLTPESQLKIEREKGENTAANRAQNFA
jgi:hypothetical protein